MLLFNFYLQKTYILMYQDDIFKDNVLKAFNSSGETSQCNVQL